VAPGWAGFHGRLQYAVAERKRQNPWLTQNAIAERADYDSGNLARLLKGEKTENMTANSALLLAMALHVNPLWLINGEEPSGLDRPLPGELYNPGVVPDAAGRSAAATASEDLKRSLKRRDSGNRPGERSS
jgi:transcriptional regulator with XRE-family HTH domain